MLQDVISNEANPKKDSYKETGENVFQKCNDGYKNVAWYISVTVRDRPIVTIIHR